MFKQQNNIFDVMRALQDENKRLLNENQAQANEIERIERDREGIDGECARYFNENAYLRAENARLQEIVDFLDILKNDTPH